jgi:hypothetical protein
MVCFSDLNKSEEAIAFLNEYLDEFLILKPPGLNTDSSTSTERIMMKP